MADDHDRLIDEVGAELGELRRTADRLDEAVAAQYGLNRTDLRCIGILYRRGRVTAGELAEESGLTPGAITTVLDRMERNGYANRVADPSDRRRVMVTSTAATRELGARVYGEVELAGRAQLEQIDPAGVDRHPRLSARHPRVLRRALRGIASPPPPGPDAASAAAHRWTGEFTAPLDGVSLGRLEFIKGAAKAKIGVDATLTGLYRGEFKGSVPDINVDGGTVTIGHRRHLLPFDWRVAKSTIALNPAVPWEISHEGRHVEARLRPARPRAALARGGRRRQRRRDLAAGRRRRRAGAHLGRRQQRAAAQAGRLRPGRRGHGRRQPARLRRQGAGPRWAAATASSRRASPPPATASRCA